MPNAANIPAEIIECTLASARQSSGLAAPFERMQQMAARLATNLPALTRDEIAAYVTDYAINHDILKIEVPA